MKIKTFVQKANNIDEHVNNWLDKHQNLKITNCHMNSQWITTDLIATKTCMVTMILQYEEEEKEQDAK